jgi:hypothetical protein
MASSMKSRVPSTLKRSTIAVGGVGVVALVGFILFNSTNGGIVPGADNPGLTTEVTNLVLSIGDRTFSMSNGLASIETVPGSATQDTVRVIGKPALGDVNRDGHRDAALLIENDPGASTTFYYAVLAVNESGSYQATNVLLLGDRIEPMTLDYLDGRFVYNYAVRGPGEPLTAVPSVRKTLWIHFDPASGMISAGP